MEVMNIVGSLDALPTKVVTALHRSDALGDAWGFAPTSDVVRHDRTVYYQNTPVLEWIQEGDWTVVPWHHGLRLRQERRAHNKRADTEYKKRLAEAASQAGVLVYVTGQEGGRLVLPSGEAVSARGLFNRLTGDRWVRGSEAFHAFLVEMTNPPEVNRFPGRKARNNPMHDACASCSHGPDRTVRVLYQHQDL